MTDAGVGSLPLGSNCRARAAAAREAAADEMSAMLPVDGTPTMMTWRPEGLSAATTPSLWPGGTIGRVPSAVGWGESVTLPRRGPRRWLWRREW